MDEIKECKELLRGRRFFIWMKFRESEEFLHGRRFLGACLN